MSEVGSMPPCRTRLDCRWLTSEWEPHAGHFSDWHYLVIEPGSQPAFTGPIAVLQDEGCFSATEIFIAAFKAQERAVLVGTATGGGSGRARRYELERSGIRIQLSPMASFQPDGRLYDGNGVAPDFETGADAAFSIGRSDPALTAAHKLVVGG